MKIAELSATNYMLKENIVATRILGFIVLIVIVKFTVKCSTANTTEEGYRSPGLMPYVLRFEKLYGQKVATGLTIKFVKKFDDGSLATGRCLIGYSKSIEIPYLRWIYLKEIEREQLMFHELGHCELGRPHNNTVLDNGCPMSLMKSHGFHTDCYRRNKSYYLNELFTAPDRGKIFWWKI